MLCAASDKTVRLWNVESEYSQVVQGHDGGLSDLNWSQDSQYFVTASDDSTVKLWSVENVSSHLNIFTKNDRLVYLIFYV